MLLSADITVDRQPILYDFLVERHIIVIRRRIAQEVPGAVQERVRDVGFSTSRGATRGTVDAVPLLHPRQGADAAVVGFEVLDSG